MAIGQLPHRCDILSISNALPCVVETTEEHGYSTDAFVRLTDLNGMMPIPRGEDPLNNYRWQIVVLSPTTFSLKYPVTHAPVDSTQYPPYVEGGYCNLVPTNFYFYGDEQDV